MNSNAPFNSLPQNMIKARELCEASLSAEQVREVWDLLAKSNLTYHPDDPIDDIVWSVELTESQIEDLIWIDNALWEACERLGIDIYEEAMAADVRAHGENSAFYGD